MELLKPLRTTKGPKNGQGKSFDVPSRKSTVITIPTYEEVEANIPKPVYKPSPPMLLRPIPPPEPIPGATVLLRACAGRLDKERWPSPSNLKSAPEYIEMCNQSTKSAMHVSIRRDTDKLLRNMIIMPRGIVTSQASNNADKMLSKFKMEFIKKWCDEDEDDRDEDSIKDDECFIEPIEKYPNNISDFDHPIEYPNDINDFIELDEEYPNVVKNFDHAIELDEEYPNTIKNFDHPIELDGEEFINDSIISKNNNIHATNFSDSISSSGKPYSDSLQKSQENEICDENSDLKNGEPPNKRKKFINDTNYTQILDSNDDNVESIEQIDDTEHEPIRLQRRIKKTQLTVTSDMDFFERLKILAPEAAAVYHELEVVEESKDTDQANTGHIEIPRDNKRWFEKDTEKFYKLVAQWGYNYSKIAELTGRSVSQIQKKFTKENKMNPKRLDDAVRRKCEFVSYKNIT